MRGRLIVYKLNCYPSPSDALSGPAQEGAASVSGIGTMLRDWHQLKVLHVESWEPTLNGLHVVMDAGFQRHVPAGR